MLPLILLGLFTVFARGDARCFCTTRNDVVALNSPCGQILANIPEGKCFLSSENEETCNSKGVNKNFQDIEYSPGLNLWVPTNSIRQAPEEKCEISEKTFKNLAKSCAAVQIVTRSQWQARPPRSRTTLTTPVSMLFIHHTAGSTCSSQAACSSSVRGIQNFHMDNRGWVDIGYNFLVGGDGRVYEGRGWQTVGAHTGCHNRRSVAFSAMGNFENVAPPQNILSTLRNLAGCGVSRGILTSNYELFGHRDAMSTACPGRNLYNTIRSWPNFSTRPIRC